MCGRYFIRQHDLFSLNDLKRFSAFIVGRVNHEQVEKDFGLSRKTVSLKFQVFFRNPPLPQDVWKLFPPKLTTSPASWVYSLDGKWLRRSGVILIHRDVINHEVLWWSYARSESYQAIEDDLRRLTSLCGDSVPTGVVSDWKGSIVGSVKLFFGDIPHQRCLAHVDRDIKRLLPKYSPIQGTQELRKIGRAIIRIETFEQKQSWLTWINIWEVFYGDLLKDKTYPRLSR